LGYEITWNQKTDSITTEIDKYLCVKYYSQ
jgi:hypothetical protein